MQRARMDSDDVSDKISNYRYLDDMESNDGQNQDRRVSAWVNKDAMNGDDRYNDLSDDDEDRPRGAQLNNK